VIFLDIRDREGHGTWWFFPIRIAKKPLPWLTACASEYVVQGNRQGAVRGGRAVNTEQMAPRALMKCWAYELEVLNQAENAPPFPLGSSYSDVAKTTRPALRFIDSGVARKWPAKLKLALRAFPERTPLPG